jgi:uncharacterized protein DUF1707
VVVANLVEILDGMSEPAGPTGPDPIARRATRIGDAERDKAAEYLREHLAAGRLDAQEFDERLTKALSAKVASDLDALFTDLPEPRPSTSLSATEAFRAPPWQPQPPATPRSELAPTAPPQPPSTFSRTFAIVTAAAWALAIVLCFVTGWQNWWILFIPIFLSWGVKHSRP